MPENNKAPANKHKKLIVTISIVTAVLLAGGGSYALYSHTNSKNGVSVEVSDSEKNAKKDLDSAQKEFDAAKKAYDSLADNASKTDREKAYNELQAAYSKLESAQKAAQKNASKSDSEKINKEIAANKNTLETAKPSSNKQSQSSNSKQKNNSNTKSCHVVHHDAVTHEEPVYSTQQVQTGTKTVVDKPAWQETVVDQPAYDNYEVDGLMCNFCGQVFPSLETLTQHSINVHDAAPSWSSHFKLVHHDAVTHVVTHPAVTHQEPVYENKQVQTGTRTVTDRAAYDEQVCE